MNESSTKLMSNIDWNQLIAGTVAGAAATAVFHPLELIKVRWQVYEEACIKQKLKLTTSQLTTSTGTSQTSSNVPAYRPKYKSLFDTIANVYKTENGVRGLYKGLGVNTMASGSAWGLYFLLYNGLKQRHKRINENNHKASTTGGFLTLSNYTVDATIAGVTTILITNPLFLLKTRMCLQYARADTSKAVKYKNTFDAFRTLIRTDGFLGLYKGIVPGIFGTLNGTIQMVTYDLMKDWWLKRLNSSLEADQEAHKLHTSHYSVFSSLSKILAVVLTYPFQLGTFDELIG
jgi:solute carrier family 25 folate transporter 32